MTPGARVLPTRSKPNRRLAAERGRTGVVGNTGSLGQPYSAETAETTHTREAYQFNPCNGRSSRDETSDETHTATRAHRLADSQNTFAKTP